MNTTSIITAVFVMVLSQAIIAAEGRRVTRRITRYPAALSALMDMHITLCAGLTISVILLLAAIAPMSATVVCGAVLALLTVVQVQAVQIRLRRLV